LYSIIGDSALPPPTRQPNCDQAATRIRAIGCQFGA